MDSRMVRGRQFLRPFCVLVLAAGVVFIDGRALAAGQTGKSGSVSRSTQGYLGVDIRDVTDELLSALKLQNTRGAIIVGMDHDGPACKSGMQVRDVILQMNGQPVEGEEQLRRMLRETPAGRQVSFLVSRDGQQRTISAQMASREEVERKAWENHYTVPDPSQDASSSAPAPAPAPKRGNSFFHGSPSAATSNALREAHSLLGTSMIVSSSYTGAKLEVMGPQLAEFFGAQGSAGLLVRHVDPGSPAADAGLKAGDVVVKVNSQQVVNGTDWSKTIRENRGKTVDVLIVRDKKEKTVTLTPDSKKRSSVESSMDIEEFFGNSDQAEQTRAALAELAPMFDAMAASMRQRVKEVRSTPEMTQLMAKLQMWSSNPDFQRQIETAQQQVRAAAAAAQERMNSPEIQQQMDRLRTQMRDMMRLD